jgi:hypothetical protein
MKTLTAQPTTTGKQRDAVKGGLFLFLLALMLLAHSCKPIVVQPTAAKPDVKSPTVASVFFEKETSTPHPTKTANPTLAPAPARTAASWDDVALIPVFVDALEPDWHLLENQGMVFDLENSEIVRSGTSAIKVSPQLDFSRLFFVLNPDSNNAYQRKHMVGLSMWINGGENWIGLSSLAFTITGSKIYPYWDEKDRSAYIDGKFPFSETRLYFMGFNSDIPPNTWVKVELFMEQLIFDPYYDYITGFYIKNDQGIYDTFYIDDVHLLMMDGGPEPLNK